MSALHLQIGLDTTDDEESHLQDLSLGALHRPVRQNVIRWRVLLAGLVAALFVTLVVKQMTWKKPSLAPSFKTASARQLLESPELADVMTNNLMAVGGMDENERHELRDKVASRLHHISSYIRERHPVTSDQLDRLILNQDRRKSVMHVMSSMGDNRVKNLADDIAEVVHEALNSGASREHFKALVVQRLQPRMAELQALRDDFFPRARGGSAETNWRPEALLQAMEKSRLMLSFDQWAGVDTNKKEDEAPARSLQQPPASAIDFTLNNQVLQPYVSIDEAVVSVDKPASAEPQQLDARIDQPIGTQLREFFREISTDFKQEFGEMRQQFVDEFGPQAVKQAVKERVDGMRQDMRDSFAVMLEDIKDSFSPSRVRARMHDKVQSVKKSFNPQGRVQDIKNGFNSIFSPAKSYSSETPGAYGPWSGGQPVTEEATDSDMGIMQCVAHILMLEPSTFIACSMQAMSYCVDMIRSMFAP